MPIPFQGGVIDTDRHWNNPDQEDAHQTNKFNPVPDNQEVSPYPRPFISVGLSFIDVGLGTHAVNPKQVGLKATATPAPGSFTSTIGPWGNGHMSGNSCTWLSFPFVRSPTNNTAAGTVSIDPLTQWVLDTDADANADADTNPGPYADPDADPEGWYTDGTGEHFRKFVPFESDFEVLPRVVVWISGFQIDHQDNVNNDFGGTAIRIKAGGFTIKFHRRVGTQVRRAQLSWFAFSSEPMANRPQCGRVVTGAVDAGIGPRLSPVVPIVPEFPFVRRPTVLQAFSRLSLGSARQGNVDHGFRVKVIDPVIDVATWNWTTRAGSWYNTVVHNTVISWIAF